VHKRRHRLTLVVDKRDRPAFAVGQPHDPARLVDPVVDTRHAVGDLDIRIAQAARECRPQCVRLEAVAEVDHESSDGGTGPTAPQQVSRQADGRDRHRGVVGPSSGHIQIHAGQARARSERKRSANHHGTGQRCRAGAPLHTAGRSMSPRRDRQDRRHERDRRPLRARELRDQPIDVRRADHHRACARVDAPARVAEQQVHERPAMRI
jgi:hypothetical protein